TVVSVGEFRDRAENVLFPGDLAIGIRDGRLYLVVCATGEHLELLTPTAINFVWNHYTPPLARFLAEISRAACPQVTGFDWGVALALPFTPALCHRRTIMIPARWRLRARQLPGRLVTLYEWTEALHSWRERLGVPSRVLLAEADQHLQLDLSQKLPLDLLRTHLASAGHAVLAEAPPADGYGWIDGRAHSVVVPMGSSR
ncbi:lantibiotic dehydratase, partial [Frankia sp. Cr1]|uniref:lantibiotic dehydratase n=1 Tax=Frankia sp. Cr1 TaxID=3073931 RepID=UPI002AD292D8